MPKKTRYLIMVSPVDTSHSMADPSLPDDRVYLPLFENCTVQTDAPSWALAYVEVQRLLIPSQI